MKKFKYESLLELEPRYGNNFGTVYYKMDKKNLKALLVFVSTVKDLVDWEMDEYNSWDEWNTPNPHFKRRGKSAHYSKYQIITDLDTQLQRGKDPTKGLVGRWNRMFETTQYEFKLTQVKKK